MKTLFKRILETGKNKAGSKADGPRPALAEAEAGAAVGIEIRAERDSVCMGDDVLAPNAEDLFFFPSEGVDALMRRLCTYVPQMRNVVWEVVCERKTLGYLFSDESGQYRYETTDGNGSVSELPSRSVFCRYYYDKREYSRERFPDCATLLERVKAAKRDRVNTGVASLCSHEKTE